MDTSLRSLFFSLANDCSAASGMQIKRTHVYQLVAACFGYGSWEAFRMKCVLADRVGGTPSAQLGAPLGRAVQMGLAPAKQTEGLIQALLAAVQKRDLRALEIAEVQRILLRHGRWPVRGQWEFDAAGRSDDAWDSADLDESDAEEGGEEEVRDELDWLSALRASSVLRASLSERALAEDPTSHLALAALLRCRRPNSYLHDEALRGRILNRTEEAMRAEYLRHVPQFAAYEHHLRAAAKAGVALAAVECALVFGEEHWLAGADFQNNPELLLAAAEVVRDDSQATDYLLRGSELGHQLALEHLAARGHLVGIEHTATQGNRDSLVIMAKRALDEGEVAEAWKWQAVAEEYGIDLRDAEARAYHSEGQHAGEAYDDDVGGPAYVLDHDTVDLPQASPEVLVRAREQAAEIVAGARNSNGHRDHGWGGDR